jgi:hypothetical protein
VKKLPNPAYWGRALSNPIVLVGLSVDLLPIYAVFAWGWNAVPLVMLYWMENVVAGVMTLPRIVISGASFGGVGFLAGAGLSLFFVFHYGLFCLVHGAFLVAFASMASPERFADVPFADISGIFRFGLESGQHVDWMICVIASFQVLVLVVEFLVKGEWKQANPMAEMMAPYGRIIVLHIAIFAGAAALFLLGQPMVGVLALILFRAIWGLVTNSKRFGLETDFDKAVATMGDREKFERMLRGQNPNAP